MTKTPFALLSMITMAFLGLWLSSSSWAATIHTVDGAIYEGQVAQGAFAGKGKLTQADGRVYEGQFSKGRYHGTGKLTDVSGDVYQGQFKNGSLSGLGVANYTNGAKHIGQFLKGYPYGKGILTLSDGTTIAGFFVRDQLKGNAEIQALDGSTYKGKIVDGQMHGEGRLQYANGDQYIGYFKYNQYDGKGTLIYNKPLDGEKQKSGLWQAGQLISEKQATLRHTEAAIYRQNDLLSQSLNRLTKRKNQETNLYLLTIAGDGTQEVFRREVQAVAQQFEEKFLVPKNQQIHLINSRTTLLTTPMASLTSIKAAIEAIGQKMDKSRDILMIYLTSHGSPTTGKRDYEVLLDQQNLRLESLKASDLAKILDDSGIQYQVIVISACYSGGFIPHLQNENRLIITAAREDRTSFGCSDHNDWTYFGKAFFVEGLSKANSFEEAYNLARQQIRNWETADFEKLNKRLITLDILTPDTKNGANSVRLAEKYFSYPQISLGKNIAQPLQNWWLQQKSKSGFRPSDVDIMDIELQQTPFTR